MLSGLRRGHGASARPGPTPAAASSLPEPHPSSSGPSPGSPGWPLKTQAAQTDSDSRQKGTAGLGEGTGAPVPGSGLRGGSTHPAAIPGASCALGAVLQAAATIAVTPHPLRAHPISHVRTLRPRMLRALAPDWQVAVLRPELTPAQRGGSLRGRGASGVSTRPGPACQQHPVRSPKGLLCMVSDKVTTSLPHCSTVQLGKQAQRWRVSGARQGHAPCLDPWPLSALSGSRGQLLFLLLVPTRLSAVPWAQEGMWPTRPSLPRCQQGRVWSLGGPADTVRASTQARPAATARLSHG